jgi:hypothetical protein
MSVHGFDSVFQIFDFIVKPWVIFIVAKDSIADSISKSLGALRPRNPLVYLSLLEWSFTWKTGFSSS